MVLGAAVVWSEVVASLLDESVVVVASEVVVESVVESLVGVGVGVGVESSSSDDDDVVSVGVADGVSDVLESESVVVSVVPVSMGVAETLPELKMLPTSDIKPF